MGCVHELRHTPRGDRGQSGRYFSITWGKFDGRERAQIESQKSWLEER